MKLQEADASVPADKKSILNTIVGNAPDAEPPETHEQFDRMNAMLAGRFAVGMLRVVIARGKDPEPFFAAIKASRATTVVLDLSTVTKFTGALLKKLTAALPVELEELDLQLAGSPAAKEEALVTALVKRLAGFAKLRSIVSDGFTPKHASLVKKMKSLQRIPHAVFPTAEARLALLDELPNLTHVDLSGLKVISVPVPPKRLRSITSSRPWSARPPARSPTLSLRHSAR